MKIVKVSNHSCIRVHKMALPLIEGGEHEVHLIAHKWTNFSENYSTFGHWLDMGQLHNFIKLHAPTTDIFHVHNEPSWFVSLIKEICDVPVVLDVHDSFAARVTSEEQEAAYEKDKTELVRITAEERNNFQLADALVFPGQRFSDIVRNEFKLTQPYIVLPSYVPRRLYRYNIQDWLGGLVYEGKVQLSNEQRHSFGFRYCNYLDTAKKCREIGMDFHVYAGREDAEFLKAYQDYAILHEPRHFQELLKDIARHDWGLVGNVNSTPEWNVAFPNKLFEYIAAGVPVVSMNAGECDEFVEREGIGIAVKSIEDLASRWREHTEIRKRLIKQRAKYSMDKNIDTLKELYRGLRK